MAPHAGRFLAVSAALVAAAAVAASIVLNPPSEVRRSKFDYIRSQELSTIGDSIDSYWQKNHILPHDLRALNDGTIPYPTVSLKDPETQTPYEYQIVDKKSYKLCAIFTYGSQDEKSSGYYYTPMTQHKAGPYCFDRKVYENKQSCP